MPPADAAPDPLDRPARALAAELVAWCVARSPPDAGAWLPALPFGEWFDWQRDLARRLAAAALAADGRSESQRAPCPHCGGTGCVTGYRPCPACGSAGAGGRP